MTCEAWDIGGPGIPKHDNCSATATDVKFNESPQIATIFGLFVRTSFSKTRPGELHLFNENSN